MLALSPKLQSPIAGKSKGQEPETVGLTHTQSSAERECTQAWLCSGHLLSAHTAQIQIQEMMSPRMGRSSHLS